MSLEPDRDADGVEPPDTGLSLFGDDEAHQDVHDDAAPGVAAPVRRRRRRRSGLKSCLVLLVVAALFVAGGVAAFTFGRDKLDALLAPPPDYKGPGTTEVLFEVKQGETVSEIGR